jgi:hypothetical protein
VTAQSKPSTAPVPVPAWETIPSLPRIVRRVDQAAVFAAGEFFYRSIRIECADPRTTWRHGRRTRKVTRNVAERISI